MTIVLVEPEIHWNTGNIGRTCVATRTPLHLVGKLGFSLDSKQIRRSGLDYWSKLKLVRHADFEAFLGSLPAPGVAGGAPGERGVPPRQETGSGLPEKPSLLFFSTRGKRAYWEAPYRPDSYLIFGNESSGLPAPIHRRYGRLMYRIPMGPDVRSLNLSTAAAVVLYEGLRQTGLSSR